MKTAKSDKQKAMTHIKRYLGVFNKGDTFYGLVLSKYVREKIGKPDVNPDTILKYMRTLRQRGELNYESVNKKNSEYIKL